MSHHKMPDVLKMDIPRGSMLETAIRDNPCAGSPFGAIRAMHRGKSLLARIWEHALATAARSVGESTVQWRI
jgi:hypothetical protein